MRLYFLVLIGVSFSVSADVMAATMQASPATGVYSINSTFSVRITVNSGGQAINAAEGELRFNPQELSVVSVNRTGSVFSLWVTEPAFSNTAGTINFSGGSPTGYTGTSGTVFTVAFRSLRAGASRVTFATGAVLANDGRGTNTLSGMSGGTYTIEAASAQPTPEVIEYVAPANTPVAPVITSATHESGVWSKAKTAELSWTLPSEVTAIRTLLDSQPTTIPTKLYETPIRTITLADLPEGESYFHIQFQNADGWGRVTHYRLAVDSEKPEAVSLTLAEGADLTNPIQTLLVEVTEATSPITRYMVRIDDQEPKEYSATDVPDGKLTLPSLSPGYHSVIVEAFDSAGNGQIGTTSFSLEAFAAPTFTDYPTEVNEGIIPVFRGLTQSDATVTITLTKLGTESRTYEVMADESGVFVFIPETVFTQGVYELSAQAFAVHGAQSAVSEPIRIAAQQPGYIQIGTLIVSVLSVVVPLIGMTVLLVLLLWWFVISSRRLRRRISLESKEAEEILQKEFADLQVNVEKQTEALAAMKRTKKLTEAEAAVFTSLHNDLRVAEKKILKEITDVGTLIKSKNKS